MRFGHFDDGCREYVITQPDTPLPWINYLGCEEFFGLISHTASGYSFYRDARLRRLVRYRYNNVPMDTGGRYIYLRDDQSGDYWSPTSQPVRRDLQDFACRHGMGYTRIGSTYAGIAAETLFFVPLGETLEVWETSVTNRRDTPAAVSLFAGVEFCLWDAQDDATNYQRNFSTGQMEIEPGVIYHKTEYRERRNHYAFYTVNAKVKGFDTDRESFLGLYNGFGEPQVVAAGKSRNSVASGWSPIGSHQLAVNLAPGQQKSLVFVLGYVENPLEEKWEKPGVVNKRRAEEVMARAASRNLAPSMGRNPST